MRLRSASALVLAALAAAPLHAAAQSQSYTLDQVEAKYPRMQPVHIKKCDRDGNGVYTKPEMLCVQGIYQQMYLTR